MKRIIYLLLIALPLVCGCGNDDTLQVVLTEPNTEEENNTDDGNTTESLLLTFTNPIMYADMPDPSIVRVGDDYYMTSTTMHFAPAVAVLHSKDMVGWEIIGHVSDIVGHCPAASMEECKLSSLNGYYHNHVYNSESGNYRNDIYAQGSWASSLTYHDGYFYCLWNIYTEGMSYISRTADPAGDWEIISSCNPIFYDSSLFFDDDGTAYICRAHDEKIYRLDSSLDLNSAVEVYDFSADRGIYNDTEGYHLFKIGNYYYFTMVMWIGGTCSSVLMRSENIDGPYEPNLALSGPVKDSTGSKCTQNGVSQGRIIDTPDLDANGNPTYYGFFHANMGSLGRSPVIANTTFFSDGSVVFGNNGSYVDAVMAAPVQSRGTVSTSSVAKSDDFSSAKLDPVWEWNHNPDNDAWSLTANPGNLRLTAVHICEDFFHARNTITQRTVAPTCYGTISMDVSHMNDGDFAGLGMLQYRSGTVGVKKTGGLYYVYMSKGIQNYDKYTQSDLGDGDYFGAMKDFELTLIDDGSTTVDLRIVCDFKANTATFYYKEHGVWRTVGEKMTMTYSLINFVGNRFAIYNYATETTGGYVDIDSFTLEVK
ncbi:MAG: glycoside hydrolase 43 family protein [Prevotella sp.]|nr:glycoside hydrolase 43 family protein [Prevotella sp.]